MKKRVKRKNQKMIKPKFPKGDAEIPHDNGNMKPQRKEEYRPKTNCKTVVTYKRDDDCAGKDNKPSSKSTSFLESYFSLENIKGTDLYECCEKYIVGGRVDYHQFLRDEMMSMDFEPPKAMEDSYIPEMALYYLRTMMGGDYEFVELVSSIAVAASNGWLGIHTNFFARLKGTDSAPEFFFASAKNGEPMEVEECCILNPRPFAIGETPPDKDMVVYHCEHVQCKFCNFGPLHDHIDERGYVCI